MKTQTAEFRGAGAYARSPVRQEDILERAEELWRAIDDKTLAARVEKFTAAYSEFYAQTLSARLAENLSAELRGANRPSCVEACELFEKDMSEAGDRLKSKGYLAENPPYGGLKESRVKKILADAWNGFPKTESEKDARALLESNGGDVFSAAKIIKDQLVGETDLNQSVHLMRVMRRLAPEGSLLAHPFKNLRIRGQVRDMQEIAVAHGFSAEDIATSLAEEERPLAQFLRDSAEIEKFCFSPSVARTAECEPVMRERITVDEATEEENYSQTSADIRSAPETSTVLR
ncbi:MAG: hypothetical protein ACI4L9_06355 [Candidatus Coproplasma sp.]